MNKTNIKLTLYDIQQLIKIMQEACQLSQKSIIAGGGPFGAVIYRDGIKIGEGHNQVVIHNDPTQHAEIVAIRNACQTLGSFDLSGCILYTSCEPCPMCLGAIYWARIQQVYYGNTRQDAENIGFSDKFIYDEIGREVSDRRIPMMQLCAEDAKIAFEEWADKTDKIDY